MLIKKSIFAPLFYCNSKLRCIAQCLIFVTYFMLVQIGSWPKQLHGHERWASRLVTGLVEEFMKSGDNSSV